MVPRIDDSRDVVAVLNYNEHKVQRGVAELLYAANFLKPMEQLNFYDKLNRFEKLNELNAESEVNTWHISLNFHPDDRLTKDQLRDIATRYMDRIGLGNQPYLVYQHHDSGHPHVHLVTSLIFPDGSRFRTNNVGRNQSVSARKEIDRLYGLRKVEDSQHIQVYEPEPVNAQKVAYGKLPTKKAIKDVLRFVLKKYKFTSLPELNAVLQQYNVLADRGAPGSRIYENGGLIYRVLTEQGNKTGVPIKASDFYFKPTLVSLQEKFEKNGPLRKADIPSIRSRIDWALGKKPGTFQAWLDELRKENIRVVVRRNDQGTVYGLTYVDFRTRSVINGSDLDQKKTYSAQAITQQFNKSGKPANLHTPPISQAQAKKTAQPIPKKSAPIRPTAPSKSSVTPGKELPNPIQGSIGKGFHTPQPAAPVSGTSGNSLLQDLTAEVPVDPLPYELTTDRKKKKKKRIRQ
jgi:hypothetical protein